MNAKDFSAELAVTRGQHEQIARGFARVFGEPYPENRVQATELLLRLSETPDPAEPPAEASAAAQGARNRAETSGSPAGRPAGNRLVIGGRRS